MRVKVQQLPILGRPAERACPLRDVAGAAFLLWECSTPFVYARWFLFTLGRADTKAYVANGLAMLASFFIFRNVLGVGVPLHDTCAPLEHAIIRGGRVPDVRELHNL